MSKITVIDSIMGSGKTSTAIQMINDNEDGKYIYITPFLKEVDRIKETCKSKRFIDPTNKGKGKMNSFVKLVANEKNIVATHSLFQGISEQTMELIRIGEYTLILDEVMDVVEQIPLKKDDLPSLLKLNLITIEDNGIVVWNDPEYDGKYNYIKDMCRSKSVFVANNVVMMWTFPVEVFRCFKEVYILTYLFDGQIQKYYYDLFNVDYDYKSAAYNTTTERYEIVNYRYRDDLSGLKELITLIENDKINSIGDGTYTLSKTWFERNKINLKHADNLISRLKKDTDNFFKHKCKSKSADNMWTTFKDYKSSIAGKGYTKGFISLGARATNEYIDKKNMAYCANIFLNPIICNFFRSKGIEVDEDTYALSELLQWIWRGQIRRGDPIVLYIPSERMRILFKEWLM